MEQLKEREFEIRGKAEREQAFMTEQNRQRVIISALPHQLSLHSIRGFTCYHGPIIETIPGTKPVKRPAFKVSPAQNAEIKKQITEYLNKGHLRPTQAPWHTFQDNDSFVDESLKLLQCKSKYCMIWSESTYCS